MTLNDIKLDKSIAELQMSGAIIVRGPYVDVANVLKDIESNLPPSCKVAYVHYYPGRLRIIEERGQ